MGGERVSRFPDRRSRRLCGRVQGAGIESESTPAEGVIGRTMSESIEQNGAGVDEGVSSRDSDRPLDRAEQAGYPPDSGPEELVIKVRPMMLRARPIRFAILSVLTLAGAGGAIWFGPISSATKWDWVVWPSLIVLIFGLVWLGLWKLQALSAALEITNKRTIEHRGLLSRATSEVLHDNIRNIQIEQSFWNRIWRVGKIGIASSGQDGIEIQMSDVPSPDNLREIIDLYRPL